MTEYQQQIMQALDDPDIREVTVMPRPHWFRAARTSAAALSDEQAARLGRYCPEQADG